MLHKFPPWDRLPHGGEPWQGGALDGGSARKRRYSYLWPTFHFTHRSKALFLHDYFPYCIVGLEHDLIFSALTLKENPLALVVCGFFYLMHAGLCGRKYHIPRGANGCRTDTA